MSIEKDTRDLRVVAEGIRLVTLQTFAHIGFGHVGGAMSIIEALAALYGGELKSDPHNPNREDRDRLVMSKGHAGPALYATYACAAISRKKNYSNLIKAAEVCQVIAICIKLSEST